MAQRCAHCVRSSVSVLALAALLLALTAVAASAAEMPRELWGIWCETEPRGPLKYEKCEKSRESIDRKGHHVSAEGSYEDAGSNCYPVKVSQEGRTSWLIRHKCYGVEDDRRNYPQIWVVRYSLLKDGRLRLDELNKPPELNKLPEMGWLCDLTTDPPTVVRAEGGAKDKRDALANCSSK